MLICQASLCIRLNDVRKSLSALEKDLNQEEKEDYPLLLDIIQSLKEALCMLGKCNTIQEDKSEIENTAFIA